MSPSKLAAIYSDLIKNLEITNLKNIYLCCTIAGMILAMR